jgi:TolB protein
MTAAAISTGPAIATASPAADVPWSEVGPGWTLATWSPVTPTAPGVEPAPGEPTWETASETLYLINPTGDRYAITTFAPDESQSMALLDWSGDGSHALFGVEYPAPDTVISVDLHTGAKSTIAVGGHPEFTRPEGRALLVSNGYQYDDARPLTLKRLDLNGNEQMRYPTEQLGTAGQFTGNHLESPDGKQLVLDTGHAMVVMGNDGTIQHTVPAPMADGKCRAVRWWSADVVLTQCTQDREGSQLWTVPLDGSAPTALTAVNSGSGDDPGFKGDLYDGIAWQLPGGTFLQSAGACGTSFLSRLTPDGHTARVNVPGMNDSVLVAGVSGDKLALLGKVGCGGTTSLVAYDPGTDSSTVLLGPPVNGGGVTEAIPFGRN